MALSVSPAACNLAIFSLAGLEKLHSSMAQVATVSLQPHWQPIWAATRRTSTLGFSAAVWARALGHAVRINSKNKSGSWRTRAGVDARPTNAPRLLRNFCIFSCYPDHFGARVLHLDFAGDQAHQRTADEHQAADPDPGDQRENVSLDHGADAVVGHAAEVEIQVFVEAGAHAYFRSTLAAGFIETLLGLEGAE